MISCISLGLTSWHFCQTLAWYYSCGCNLIPNQIGLGCLVGDVWKSAWCSSCCFLLIFLALLIVHTHPAEKSTVVIKLGVLYLDLWVWSSIVHDILPLQFYQTSANLFEVFASFISTVFPDLICRWHISFSQNFVKTLKLCTAAPGDRLHFVPHLSTLSHICHDLFVASMVLMRNTMGDVRQCG